MHRALSTWGQLLRKGTQAGQISLIMTTAHGLDKNQTGRWHRWFNISIKTSLAYSWEDKPQKSLPSLELGPLKRWLTQASRLGLQRSLPSPWSFPLYLIKWFLLKEYTWDKEHAKVMCYLTCHVMWLSNTDFPITFRMRWPLLCIPELKPHCSHLPLPPKIVTFYIYSKIWFLCKILTKCQWKIWVCIVSGSQLAELTFRSRHH